MHIDWLNSSNVKIIGFKSSLVFLAIISTIYIARAEEVDQCSTASFAKEQIKIDLEKVGGFSDTELKLLAYCFETYGSTKAQTVSMAAANSTSCFALTCVASKSNSSCSEKTDLLNRFAVVFAFERSADCCKSKTGNKSSKSPSSPASLKDSGEETLEFDGTKKAPRYKFEGQRILHP